MPDAATFAAKPDISLAQIRHALASGIPMGFILTDVGYGDETSFRDGITELRLLYAVGIRPATTGWAPVAPSSTGCGEGIGNGIAAYGFLMAERFSQDRAKKTPLDQKRLPSPKLTSLAAAGRTNVTCLTRLRRCDRRQASAVSMLLGG